MVELLQLEMDVAFVIQLFSMAIILQGATWASHDPNHRKSNYCVLIVLG